MKTNKISTNVIIEIHDTFEIDIKIRSNGILNINKIC
jgi:hypothetical protein